MKIRSLLSKLGGLSAGSLLSWPVFFASIGVCAVVLGVRQLQALEELELNSFDQLVQWRPDEGTDPRLLVVGVTEADITALGKWPASDQTLDQLLKKLEQYKPRVIGLDIYRDLAVEPGNPELVTRLQVNKDIIAVCKDGDSGVLGVAPPPTVPESRLGFSDIVVDPRGIVRRDLLFLTPEPKSPCPATRSFGLQLALHYLAKEGVQAQLTPQEYLQIGSTLFKPIEKNTSGYQNVDARGYQILLNYRSPSAVAQQVSLTDVLKGRINPSWVKDRVVLIGVTAASGNDFFYTPYSSSQQQDFRMPGVLVHAQMVSQILSAVLNQRPLFWIWPGWGEMAWVWVWSLVGGVLAWRIRHPLVLVVAGGVALGGLVGVCYVILTQGGWVPLVPPALALIVTGASVISYRAYRIPVLEPEPTLVPDDDGTDIPVELQNNEPPIPPILVGRYKSFKVIGGGGFGRTYLAEDILLPGSPHCVVKQLVPARKDEKFLQIAKRLFRTEAETLEELGRHEQIPQLLAYFEQDKEFYLVQAFIKGQSLSDELKPGEPMPESEVVALLKDVLGILDFIHTHNPAFIHRDIKPANIIRQEHDKRLVLIDFGAVKVKQLQTQIHEKLPTHSERQKNPLTIPIGTIVYAAPEQLLGEPVFNSDIYSLGVIGIQAVTGMLPNVLDKDPLTHNFMWRDYAQVSDQLANILDKMVRYYSSERYQSAAEVLQAFQAIA